MRPGAATKKKLAKMPSSNEKGYTAAERIFLEVDMQAILMAAGVGSRISNEIKGPKNTLSIGDQSIIAHTVRMLGKNGCEANVVVGYEKEYIFKALEGLPVNYIENPFYRVTNSIGSLWLAREVVKEAIEKGEDLICANADVYWEQSVLDKLLASTGDTVMLGDVSRALVGDYFFKLDDKGHILDYGKTLAEGDRHCEYVGIALIRNEILPRFYANMERLIWQENYDMWWEDILYRFCEVNPINVTDVDGLFWAEVDYFHDYERILAYLDIDMASVSEGLR
jgi:L-glutamine-phosphate cytidylyltransferase